MMLALNNRNNIVLFALVQYIVKPLDDVSIKQS